MAGTTQGIGLNTYDLTTDNGRSFITGMSENMVAIDTAITDKVKVNDIPSNVNFIASGGVVTKLASLHKINSSNILNRNLNVNISENGLTFSPASLSNAWNWASVNIECDELIFSYVDCEFIVLFETESECLAISMVNGRFLKFTATSYEVIRVPSSFTQANSGDTIKIQRTDTGITASIKRTSNETFSEWFITDFSTMSSELFTGKSKLFGFLNSKTKLSSSINYVGFHTNYDMASADSSSIHIGKKLATIGDSFTMQGKYQLGIIETLGLQDTFLNYGLNGRSTVEMVSQKSWLGGCANADIITFWMGTNDFGQEITLGEIDTTDTTTTTGALRDLFTWLSGSAFNNKIKLIILPMQRWGYNKDPIVNPTMTNSKGITLEQYANRIKEIANEFGLPVLDMYHESGVNKLNASYYTYDGLHPTDSMYKKAGYMIAKKIETLL